MLMFYGNKTITDKDAREYLIHCIEKESMQYPNVTNITEQILSYIRGH